MSKFLELAAVAGLALAVSSGPAQAAGDAEAGEKLFRRCAACHAVGEGASHKLGPHLNGVIGRAAGSADGFKYSRAMVEAGASGMVWTDETLDAYLADPRGYIEGNRMSFAGLRKESDRADVIAYLKSFSGEAPPAAAAPAEPAAVAPAAAPARPLAASAPVPEHGVFHLGRVATAEEIAAWDIDVRPDGVGLPEGSGTVAEGEALYEQGCASCHGTFGEGSGRWPVLAGGHDTLKAERPVKTIGSYWPYLSTVYDYVRRAMPFGNARSLSDDEVYAITAYLLFLNDVVTEESFELSKENFTSIRLPNEANFILDNRKQEAHNLRQGEPCMADCKTGPAEITARARVLDVTPDGSDDGQGAVD